MKLYSFIEPHYLDDQIVVEIVLTKEQVLKFYWQSWKERMENLGRQQYISEENCIDDFIVVNWATVCEEEAMPPPEYGVVRMDYDMWLDYQQRVSKLEER